MPILESTQVQVLLLEMQPEIVASVKTIPEASLRRVAAILCRTCEDLAVPVTATIVPLGPEPPRLVPEFEGLSAVTRNTVSPFDDPALAARLAESGRRVLAIAGVSSELAILNTGLAALRAGYEVHLLVDACGGLSERTEAAAFRQLEIAGVRPSSVSSFLTGLVGDMATPTGGRVMSAMAELWSWGVPG